MSSRQPDEWPGFAHQHRIPSVLPGLDRGDLRRGVRLAMAAGTILTGVCLIAGTVALVVAAGEPSARTLSASSAANAKPASVSPDGRQPTAVPANPVLQAGRTVASFAGLGPRASGPFTIPVPGTWGLRWSYRGCPSNRAGAFAVGETQTSAGGAVRLSESAASAEGISWFRGDAGTHRLVVVSRCSWKLRVVTPARTGLVRNQEVAAKTARHERTG